MVTPLHQHGFIKRRFTETNLAVFSQNVSKSMHEQHQVDTINMDIQKGFDQEDIFLFVRKYSSYGLLNRLCNLMFLLFTIMVDQFVILPHPVRHKVSTWGPYCFHNL